VHRESTPIVCAPVLCGPPIGSLRPPPHTARRSTRGCLTALEPLTLIPLIARFAGCLLLRREWVSLRAEILRHDEQLRRRAANVPPLVVQRLLVSAEDHRHGRHPGFDLLAICGALVRRVVAGRHGGASTIEQQIVRVFSNRFERTFSRKLREILLASLVADLLPKSATPPLYLSVGYFGWRMNGFIEACRRLGLQPDALSVDEAAALVARLKYPEPRCITIRRREQIDRRRRHLRRLLAVHLEDGTYDHLGVRNAAYAVRSRRAVDQAEAYS
jgi:membrane carboxypeptidase/penicillin-binding protein